MRNRPKGREHTEREHEEVGEKKDVIVIGRVTLPHPCLTPQGSTSMNVV